MVFGKFLNGKLGRLIENLDRSAATGKSMAFLVLLILAGFLGDYFAVPLFFGADFLFGSIAVLLVLYLYGFPWGIFAAFVAHGKKNLIH